jgi:hexosaminidase
MRKNRNVLLAILGLCVTFVSATETGIQLIPQPQSVQVQAGVFTLNAKTRIVANAVTQTTALYLQTLIEDEYGYKTTFSSDDENGAIAFILNKNLQADLGDEGYRLTVTPAGIQIEAVSNTGLFYGVQTLRQLIKDATSESDHIIPCVSIEDKPRFKWRAHMLDESRYFSGQEYVKLLLDEMARLKMNVFHWHLTDDAGWRIEIKRYPKLTAIGSQRKDSQVGEKKWNSKELSGEPHGGFYTQEQIKEIVKYAAERHITVVPEIEMPGHSSAAIAAYAWLGTDKKEIEVPVTFGRKRDIYDVTDAYVLEFLQNVLDEVMTLFPSKYIHIGGDEVDYTAWRESEHVQKYMKEKGLNTPADLQIYFTNNMSQYIAGKGRVMMGWNEIMGINIHKGFEEKKDDKDAETELAKEVLVHFWKGDLKLAQEAAAKGYGIVNSLHSSTYLDYSYKSISLENAYDFDPVPEGLEMKYHSNIFGLGTQMWTEWTPAVKDVQHQTFPRLAAYAEVGWTNLDQKNYRRFSLALEVYKKRWKALGINFADVK